MWRKVIKLVKGIQNCTNPGVRFAWWWVSHKDGESTARSKHTWIVRLSLFPNVCFVLRQLKVIFCCSSSPVCLMGFYLSFLHIRKFHKPDNKRRLQQLAFVDDVWCVDSFIQRWNWKIVNISQKQMREKNSVYWKHEWNCWWQDFFNRVLIRLTFCCRQACYYHQKKAEWSGSL